MIRTMKKTALLLLGAFITAIAYGQENPNQITIDAAFVQSFATQQNQIESVLNKLKDDESDNAYWIAYGQLQLGIFYLQTGQKEKAKAIVNTAIQQLENIEAKNSEEHALLGYLLGFSISLDPSGAGRLSAKAARQYKAALKKDENNLRAYLGLGESDFYKPTAYGGGKEVEVYLLKAISLPEQSMEHGPSWGKNSAYYTLANFYVREGQEDKAKMYCVQGLDKYPGDFRLSQLKQSF